MTITEGGKAFTGWPTKGQPSFQAVQGFSGMGLVPRLHSCVLWVQKTPEAWRVSLSVVLGMKLFLRGCMRTMYLLVLCRDSSQQQGWVKGLSSLEGFKEDKDLGIVGFLE